MTVNSKMPNSKRQVTLPGSIRDFVERQATHPLESLFEDSNTPSYPCCEYWRRPVAAMLLSGRIAAKDDGFPNMTDVNRICKEANFDPYLFEATGRFLLTAKIIRPNQQSSRYQPAKFSDAFWNHQLQPLQETARQAFLKLVQHFTPFRVGRPTLAVSSMLDVLVALFAAAFADLAIPRNQAGNVFREFNKLPSPDLIDLGRQLGLKKHECDAGGWDGWLDEPGQQAFLSALYVSSWAYTTDRRIHGGSAIVQPESAEVLEAIRQHSRLKGYLEAGAPKGYLLIKQQSNPMNFVQRCKELGFRVTVLQS